MLFTVNPVIPLDGDNEPLTPPIFAVSVFPSLAKVAEETIKLAEALAELVNPKNKKPTQNKSAMVLVKNFGELFTLSLSLSRVSF